MTVEALLALVHDRGAEAFIRGDRLVLRPKSRLTTEIIDLLKSHKTELVRYLNNGIGMARPPEPHRRCPSCGGGLQPDDDDLELCFTCRWGAPGTIH